MASPGDCSPPVLVLTGGVASGKSAVSEQFSALGVPVIDTDVLARELVQPGSEALGCIVEAFGDEILQADGSLDRTALRRLVFSRPEARQRLESILHPRIEAAARARIAALKPTAYCVLVVPLLVETGLFSDADQVLVVDTSEALQLQRLIRRDGIDEDAARRMLAAQASRSERLARADHVFDNRDGLEALRAQVNQLHKALHRHYGAKSDAGTAGPG
ncbi:MAG: dephospho-CoA kinase [Wenzhouxiangella sp.]